jgi:hypothetical protein
VELRIESANLAIASDAPILVGNGFLQFSPAWCAGGVAVYGWLPVRCGVMGGSVMNYASIDLASKIFWGKFHAT